jgi:hypothetical protein
MTTKEETSKIEIELGYNCLVCLAVSQCAYTIEAALLINALKDSFEPPEVGPFPLTCRTFLGVVGSAPDIGVPMLDIPGECSGDGAAYGCLTGGEGYVVKEFDVNSTA